MRGKGRAQANALHSASVIVDARFTGGNAIEQEARKPGKFSGRCRGVDAYHRAVTDAARVRAYFFFTNLRSRAVV
jgi:hypothetical protein